MNRKNEPAWKFSGAYKGWQQRITHPACLESDGPLEIERELSVQIIGVGRAAGRCQGTFHVIADEEMPVTALECRVGSEGAGHDEIDLGADIAAIIRVDAVTPGGAPRAGHGVKGVVRVREPERVIIQSDIQ